MNNKGGITSTVALQAACPLATAVSTWMKGGQHALIVDADFPDGRKPLVQLVHVLLGQRILLKWNVDINLNISKNLHFKHGKTYGY